MEGIKVLLVDDEIPFITTLGKRLGKRGFDVVEAHDGEEALAAMEQREAEVVILDVKMPGMDGLTALYKIKQQWPMTEVLMLTGHASMEAAIRGMELGAFDYLLKPIKIDQLLYKIQDAYKKKSLTDQKIVQKKETFGRAE